MSSAQRMRSGSRGWGWLCGLCGLLWLLAPASARAGGWARDLGGVYLRLGFGAFIGQGAFLFAPGAPSGQSYSLAGELYGEVGLSHGFEVDLSARYVDNRNALEDGNTLSRSGPEDLEFLLKWSPVHAWHALALLCGARVSLYTRQPLSEVSDGTPQLGAGGQDLLCGAAYGRSLQRWPAWFGVEAMLRLRLGGASSGLRLRLEAGSKLVGPLQGVLNLEVQPAFGRDLDQPDGSPAPVPLGFGLGLKLLCRIAAGFGVGFDFMAYPPVINDGPGYRVGLGATYEFAGVARPR